VPYPEDEERERRREERHLLGEERQEQQRRRRKELRRGVPDPEPPSGRGPQRREQEYGADHVGAPGDERDAFGVRRMEREDDRARGGEKQPARQLPREEPEEEAGGRVRDQVREMKARGVRAVEGPVERQAQDRDRAEVRVVEERVAQERVERGAPQTDQVRQALDLQLGSDHDPVVPNEAVAQGPQVGK